MDTFIHHDYWHRKDVRYIKETAATAMSKDDLLSRSTPSSKEAAFPFDERPFDFCEELDFPILKIASSEINDWILIEKIAATRRPLIASTGGSSLKDIDDMVTFFPNRNIPLAINHCVSIYPSEKAELELNQIDFLGSRHPDNVIRLSTHE